MEMDGDVISVIKKEMRKTALGLLFSLEYLSRNRYGKGVVDLFFSDPEKFLDVILSYFPTKEAAMLIVSKYFLRPVLLAAEKPELEAELVRTLFENPEVFSKKLNSVLNGTKVQ
jgi:hypothetical protein